MRFRIFGKLFTVPKKLLYISAVIFAIVVVIVGKTAKNDTNQEKTLEIHEITPAPDKKTEKTDEKYISVYIIGCVKTPGIYSVPEKSIINKVVLAAGGLTEEADREHVNLAATVYDGMMIRIPSVNDEDKSFIVADEKNSSGTAVGTGEKIDINKADETVLSSLPGIGESTARKIVMYRKENGPFETVEDIMNVPGIKEGKYSSIKDYITVS